MNRFFLLFSLVLSGFFLHGTANAQEASCDLSIGKGPFFDLHAPSALEWLLDDYPLPSDDYSQKISGARPGQDALGWLDFQLFTGKTQSVLAYVQADDNFRQTDSAYRYLYTGLAFLREGNYRDAALSFSKVPHDSCTGTARRLELAAAYAAKYGADGNGPIFPRFNGGFANFLADSLKGDLRSKSIALGKAQAELFRVNRLFGGNDPVLQELIGDLLLNGPDPVLKKWLSAAAYLKTGLAKSGEDSVEFEQKAIYCLESDRMNPKYFNRYRFNKFREALKADMANAANRRNEFQQKEDEWLGTANPDGTIGEFYPGYPTPSEQTSYLPDREGSQVMTLIIKEQGKSMAQSAGPNPNANPMNPDIDVKGIKSNTTYNFYAVGLIAIVIGSIIFMYLRVRKAEKERDGR